MRLSIKLKLAFILAASALGMIGTIGAFTFLLRSSQNTLTAINAGTKAEFEVALNAVEQAATIATFGIGYLLAFVDRRRRTLHDRIAGTVVVEV